MFRRCIPACLAAVRVNHMHPSFPQKGDLGCRALYGAPRVQPLNDYRLIFFVKKCLDAYIVSYLADWLARLYIAAR